MKSFSLDAGVPTGAWHRFALGVVVGPPATVSFKIDSTAVIDAGALDPRFTSGVLVAAIGPLAQGPAPAEELNLDNIVIDIKP